MTGKEVYQCPLPRFNKQANLTMPYIALLNRSLPRYSMLPGLYLRG